MNNTGARSLFVLPVDGLSLFAAALESQLHEYSPNKGNGCEEKIRNIVQLYDAEAVHHLEAGLEFRRFLKFKGTSRHPPKYLAVCCIISLFTDSFELTRNTLRKRECK